MIPNIGPNNTPSVGKVRLIMAIRDSVFETTGVRLGLKFTKDAADKIINELQAEVDRQSTKWGVGDKVYECLFPKNCQEYHRHGTVVWMDEKEKIVMVHWDDERFPTFNAFWGDLYKVVK